MYHNRNIAPSAPTIDIIPNRFVFSVIRLPPTSTEKIFFFSVDNDEQFLYQPFFADFGPLSLLQIHVFLIVALNHMADHSSQIVNFYCSPLPQNISNAVLLSAAFRLIHLGMSSDEALKPFSHITSHLKPFRDASSYPSTYDLTVMSCLKGLEKAMGIGWYNPNTFDPQSWSDREQVENGDMNWLIPNKLLAFASPYSTNNVQGFRVCTPTDIVPTFKEIGITRIIRLNNKTYEENIFKEAGFVHTELFFPDGTNPPPQILQDFLDIIEGSDIVALHCKAGLGRTGTLAGCHMIKNFGFTAHEAIGWIRICRPGSVIGPQQQFLIKYDNALHKPAAVQSTHVTPRMQNFVKGTKKPSLSRPDRGNAPRTAIASGNTNTNNYGSNYGNNNNINGNGGHAVMQPQRNPTSSARTGVRTAIKPKPKTPHYMEHISGTNSANRKGSGSAAAASSVGTTAGRPGIGGNAGEGMLQIQAVAITPTVPQPRKLQRAAQRTAVNSRKTPRK